MSIGDLVAAVQASFDGNKFDKFIFQMCFPRFKNFVPETKIDLNFPIAVIVGPNGGGKSSLLHAAWGMPLKHSTSRFWFSTPVDPIDYDKNDRQRYWYTHYIKQLNLRAQTRKIAGNKRHGYWEPSRVAVKEGMDPMPEKTSANAPFMSDTGDRWTPVARNTHYFNPKTDTSAFDRFFNSGLLNSLEEKQDYFVRYSQKLKRVIDGDLKSYTYYNVNRVSANFMLSSEQLRVVNSILQKKYKSARYIGHTFYDRYTFSPSVIFETDARNYSECFAGSGELAVVNLVLALDKVEQFDLLLLDEPETSLHPGAQKKLLEHLLKVVKDKFVQVIISTHSPIFVEHLPQSALVVLEETDAGVHSRIAPTKASAFSRLGAIAATEVVILTEDRLLKAFVQRALSRVDRTLRLRVKVVADDVGVSEMLSNQVRALIRADSKALMVLDGDQSGVGVIFNKDVASLSPIQRAEAIAELAKMDVSVVGSKASDDFDSWMRWCKERVIIIDQICPEQVFLEILSPQHPLLANPSATNKKFKEAVKSVLHQSHNDDSMNSQFTIFNLKLGEVQAGSNVDKYLDGLAEELAAKLVQFAN